MTAGAKFEFTPVDLRDGRDAFIISIPSNLASKSELLDVFAREARFPDYFGRNWDALQDCIRDLSWLESRTMIVMHSDLPLHGNPQDCAIYLSILRTALVERTVDSRRTTIEPPPQWPYVEHELRVVFPLAMKPFVISYIR